MLTVSDSHSALSVKPFLGGSDVHVKEHAMVHLHRCFQQMIRIRPLLWAVRVCVQTVPDFPRTLLALFHQLQHTPL